MGIDVEDKLLAKETCVLIDRTDNSDLPVNLISVTEADPGALEQQAKAIAITLVVVGRGQFVAYGLDLTDGDFVVTTSGSIPAAAMKKASEITERWVAGDFTVPFYAESAASE
jgi:hypothetical protein